MTLQAVTPWGAKRRIAALIGVAPDAFWRLSLKEWRMLTEAPGGAVPMGRTALEQLMEDWPDDG